MSKSTLLDKNIVIDIILGRSRKDSILSRLAEYQTAFISTNTFVTLFYVLKKLDKTKNEIFSDLNDFELIEIDKSDCLLGYNQAQNIDDIEDCIELLTAKRNKMEIITADVQMFQRYGHLGKMVLIKN